MYWFLIKYKRVKYNILAAKLYKIAHGFNIRPVIKAILEKILTSAILFVLYINSKSLYNYFVKLKTT